jgi:hypothetical protein
MISKVEGSYRVLLLLGARIMVDSSNFFSFPFPLFFEFKGGETIVA